MTERERERERLWLTDSEPQPPLGPSVRSAIHESQQLTSPIGFLSWKLQPLPCAVLLVHMQTFFNGDFPWPSWTYMWSGLRVPRNSPHGRVEWVSRVKHAEKNCWFQQATGFPELSVSKSFDPRWNMALASPISSGRLTNKRGTNWKANTASFKPTKIYHFLSFESSEVTKRSTWQHMRVGEKWTINQQNKSFKNTEHIYKYQLNK